MLMKDGVTITERGWAEPTIIGKQCEFHRNTLIQYNDISWVVSTIGLFHDYECSTYRLLGLRIAFRTEAWIAKEVDGLYVGMYDRAIRFTTEGDWYLSNFEDIGKADAMHDKHVAVMCDMIKENWRVRNGKH